MKCPHCTIGFHANWEDHRIAQQGASHWYIRHCLCSECGETVFELGLGGLYNSPDAWRMVHPKGSARGPVPVEVDDPTLLEDYGQACLVLSDSPPASAALSRRCLQHILREKGGAPASDLNKEIDYVLVSKSLPGSLAENLDYVREVGNFGTHPIKSTNSGEVMPVEEGEAEFNLDVVEGLMDHYFVAPAKAKAKRDALNERLAEAGRRSV